MSDYANCLMNGCAFADLRGRACEGCGFDRTEAQLRRMILAQRGLTRSRKTGLRRLVLKRGKEQA